MNPPEPDLSLLKSNLQNAHVLVVGDAMLDRYWYGAVDRISPEAPVPVVRVQRTEERLGAAANVALNIASLGASTGLLTVAGQDADSLSLERLLAHNGIAAHIARDADLQTIVKLRVIGRQQQLIRLDFESKPREQALLEQAKLFEQQLSSADAVLLSDYAKGSLKQAADLIKMAQAANKPVLVDPKGNDWRHYAGATVLTPNRSELEQVVGEWESEDELEHKAHALRERLQLQALLLTRSEAGMTLFDAQGRADVKATAREVFDVTGAGDTVIAVLAALHATGMSLRQALPHANRAGGIVVGKLGTASVSFEELFRGAV